MEDWDAKGGFHIHGDQKSKRMTGKTITDVGMATIFGVEPEAQLGQLAQQQRGKRPAGTSQIIPLDRWTQKKSKQVTASTNAITETVERVPSSIDKVLHLYLAVGISHDDDEREVVDHNQPSMPRCI